MTDPLGAPRAETATDPWAGVWIAEDIELIRAGIENGSWVDGTLGGVGAGLDALALISDPAGVLLQYGVAWIIEHVRPLSEALDRLAGDPAEIAANARTWRTMAGDLDRQADEIDHAVRFDLSEWAGGAGDPRPRKIPPRRTDRRETVPEDSGRARGIRGPGLRP